MLLSFFYPHCSMFSQRLFRAHRYPTICRLGCLYQGFPQRSFRGGQKRLFKAG